MNRSKKSLSSSIIMSSVVCLALCLACLTACDTDAVYKEEQYKKVVYLLSRTDNIFVETYTLNETEPVRYITVGIGGSLPNDQDVVVELEYDMSIFNRFNNVNYNNQNDYAKLLHPSRYEIDSYTVTIPANPVDQYVKVPVKVRPLGLSPDSIYFIPLAIKSVSRYEVNEEKYNMLFRVTFENDYATTRSVTSYVKRGILTNQSNNAMTMLTGNKTVQPLTKDKIRMFIGNETQGTSTTVADIERLAIVVEIKSDNTVEITPYGTMEVEMLDSEGYNRYVPDLLQGMTTQRVFYLHYRYRLMNADGSHGTWMEMFETLTRIED